MTVKFAGVDDVKSITLTGDVLAAEDYDKWKAENSTPAIVKTPAAAATPVKSARFKPAVTTKAAPATPAKSLKAKKPAASTTKS